MYLKKLKTSQLRRVARKVGVHVTSTDRKSDILQKLIAPLGHYSMIKNETKDDLRRLIENPTKEEMNRRERKGKVQYVATQVCIVGENDVNVSLVKIYEYILRVIHSQNRINDNRLDEKLTWDYWNLVQKYQYLCALNDFLAIYCSDKVWTKIHKMIWTKKAKVETYDPRMEMHFYPHFENKYLRIISNRIRKELKVELKKNYGMR